MKLVGFLKQVELATRELVEDEVPHGKDIPRILAGLVKESESPGALRRRAEALVEAGIVDAAEFAEHFVKTQVEVTPVEGAGEKSEPEPEPEPVKPAVSW